MKATGKFNMKSFEDGEAVKAWKAEALPELERVMAKWAKQPVRGRTNV
jgi:hypothetical protein